jgi:hypothetical protein
MQPELLDQRIAQLGVVVHDQDLADIRHSCSPRARFRRPRRWPK